MLYSVHSVRGTAAGLVGAGVLAGAMLIGPVPPAQAAVPVAVPAAVMVPTSGPGYADTAPAAVPDVNNVITMGWHATDLPQGPWHPGWGHLRHWWHWWWWW